MRRSQHNGHVATQKPLSWSDKVPVNLDPNCTNDRCSTINNASCFEPDCTSLPTKVQLSPRSYIGGQLLLDCWRVSRGAFRLSFARNKPSVHFSEESTLRFNKAWINSGEHVEKLGHAPVRHHSEGTKECGVRAQRTVFILTLFDECSVCSLYTIIKKQRQEKSSRRISLIDWWKHIFLWRRWWQNILMGGRSHSYTHARTHARMHARRHARTYVVVQQTYIVN